MKNEGLTLIITSLDSEVKAGEIAETLVVEKLAACVSVFPGVLSCYFWKNKLCREKEIILLIKTRTDLFDSVRNRLLEIHPYDTPEIISLPINNALDKYAEWVIEKTGKKN